MDRERILVTGAAGLVGSHVVDLLKAQGRDVIGIGRLDCDLRDADMTYRMLRVIEPTRVFHSAACVYGIMGNLNHPGRSFRENIQINTNVIEAARKVGVSKITAMGTGCVYPFPPPRIPMVESDIFMGRPHPSEAAYAHAKLAMLAQLETYGPAYNLDWAYIVACNMYGPGDKFNPVSGHVVPSLIRKFYEAKRDGADVTVWGDGSAQRDFLYARDAAHAGQLVMDGVSGPINMGSGTVSSIREVVETLERITGIRRTRWDAGKPNGQPYREYDLNRLRDTGFKPRFTLEDGLAETWEWYCNARSRT